MKKIWSFIVSIAANPVISEAGHFLDTTLEKYYENNPKAAAALVAGLYPFIDTIVEDYAAQTSNTLDDKLVAEIKRELQEFAAKHEIELSNVDGD